RSSLRAREARCLSPVPCTFWRISVNDRQDSPVTLASFISSGTSHAVLNGLLFFAFVLWLCLGFWTYKDAKRRMEDPLFVGLSVLVALVIPYLGPFIYMLFR